MQEKMPRYLPYSLAGLWLWSGIQPLVCVPEASLALLAEVGIPEDMRWPVFLAASGLDVLFGLLSIWPLTRKRPELWAAQLATVAAYSLLIAFKLPQTWLHPFAPLVKNVPVMALMFYLWRMAK